MQLSHTTVQVQRDARRGCWCWPNLRSETSDRESPLQACNGPLFPAKVLSLGLSGGNASPQNGQDGIASATFHSLIYSSSPSLVKHQGGRGEDNTPFPWQRPTR